MRGVVIAAAVLLGGCTSDEWPPLDRDGSSSSGGSGGPVGTRLVIGEPQAGGIYFGSEPIPLLAEVLDEDGFPVDDAEIVWFTNDSEASVLEGPEGEVMLPLGIHDVRAVTRNENGRLETVAGGVRVQSEYTGVYAGDAGFTLEVELGQGMPLFPTCAGSFDMDVNVEGTRLITGPGACTLNVVITSFDVGFTIFGDVVGSTVNGTVELNFAGFLSPTFDFTGVFVEDRFAAIFDGSLDIPIILSAPLEGNITAERVTRVIDAEIDDED